MQRTLAVGMLFLPIFRALAAEEPGSAVAGVEVVSDANESVPPKVRILSGARTTFQDSPFVGFSCQATNPAKDVAMFVGYRADSFDPPTPEGQISPIYIVELLRDDKWEKYPIGWCGTGIDGIELAAGGSGAFGFAVPLEPAWTAVRVGIRWSRPLDFSTAQSGSFKIAWSEPMTLADIDKAKDKEGGASTRVTGYERHLIFRRDCPDDGPDDGWA